MYIMEIWHAVVLGVVEGITEFLPISSTGHLILAEHFLGVGDTAFAKSFTIAIQLGAILAVIALYGKTLLRDRAVLTRIMTAFIPTALIGFALYKTIKGFLGNETLVLWMLALGGVLMILFEKTHREERAAAHEIATVPYRVAFLIGCFQALAVVPGVSRSAATIIGGLLLGVSRVAIVEFSFLLAIPTMLAATGYDILKSGTLFAGADWGVLAAGFITAFVVALGAVKFLLAFIKQHTFIPFGIYRIILAVVLAFIII